MVQTNSCMKVLTPMMVVQMNEMKEIVIKTITRQVSL